MLRFILWSLLFYGIYRLIWPRQHNVSSTGSGQDAAGYNARKGANGAASKNARANPNVGSGQGNSPNQPYTRAAEEVGEYIEYEEVH